MAKRAVIFTGLVNIDKNLVGTAVIYKKIADLMIKKGYEVSMVIPKETDLVDDRIDFHLYDEEKNKKLINSSSVVTFGAYPPPQPLWYAYYKKKTIVTYLWSVAPIGSLEFQDFAGRYDQKKLHEFITSSFNLSLLVSDKIFCRDERIKTFLWGALTSLGRINLDNYIHDKKLYNIIESAPFGIESKPPKHTHDIYRGKYDGIGKQDLLLIWNGGVWNWNDGETLIKAMKKLRDSNIKLIFQGFVHPDKEQEMSQEAKRTLKLARQQGVENENVFFPKDWIPFHQRGNYLTECDVGVVSSPDIPEANLFLKTRIYDYLWAELPIILNDSEAFASLVEENGLGLVARTGDVSDWAEKIRRLKKDTHLRKGIIKNIKNYKRELTWTKTLKPVERYLEDLKKIKDKHNKENELLQWHIKVNKGRVFGE